MEVRDAVVVITGASSGIGAASAQAFSMRGASVVLAARSEDDLKQVQSSLQKGSESLIVPTDVRSEQQVRNLVDTAMERFGRIDVLVNNAGLGIFGEVIDLSAEEFDSVVSVNLRGAFLCLKYVLPQMYSRMSGTVVMVSSVAGRHGFASGGAYCASKFGLMGLTESVFQEARARNVRVVALTPGSVNTPFFERAGTTPPNRERIIQPMDVAETIVFAVMLPDHTLIRELDIRPTNPRG
jgi:3-oxoacyl-[acyl-carrier protein] reductase